MTLLNSLIPFLYISVLCVGDGFRKMFQVQLFQTIRRNSCILINNRINPLATKIYHCKTILHDCIHVCNTLNKFTFYKGELYEKLLKV